MKRFADKAVAAVFETYPPGLRHRLMALRKLIFEVAAATEGVGKLTETLKWGQPSYLTLETRSGSTVRIDRVRKADGYAIYFHCRSGLIDRFREAYPDMFRCEGQRALLFEERERLPLRALRHCIGLALTHHRRAK